VGVKILGDQSRKAGNISNVTFVAKEDILNGIVGIIRRV